MRRLCINLICCLVLTILCACSVTGGDPQSDASPAFPSQLSLPGATVYQKGSNGQIDQIIDTLESEVEKLRGTTIQAYYLVPLQQGENFHEAQYRVDNQIFAQLSHDSRIANHMGVPIDPLVVYRYINHDDALYSVGVMTLTNEMQMLVIYATSNAGS